MKIELTAEQAKALEELLEGALGEMSHEIAASDNASYRHTLVERRDALREVHEALARSLTV
jgi:hypothetical protein